MHLEELGPTASRGLALVMIPCQDPASHTRGNGGGIAPAVFTDCCVATQALGIGSAYLAHSIEGGNGHPPRGLVLDHMDLHWWPRIAGPPGPPRLLHLDQGRQGLEQQLRPLGRNPTQLMEPFDQGSTPRFLLRCQLDPEMHGQLTRRHHQGRHGQQLPLPRGHPGPAFDSLDLGDQFLAGALGCIEPAPLGFRRGDLDELACLGVPQLAAGHGLAHSRQVLQLVGELNEIPGA